MGRCISCGEHLEDIKDPPMCMLFDICDLCMKTKRVPLEWEKKAIREETIREDDDG